MQSTSRLLPAAEGSLAEACSGRGGAEACAGASSAPRQIAAVISRRSALVALTAIWSPLTARGAGAQPYPVKPIRLVHSSTAGGPIDTLARAVADSVGAQLGVPVIVDSKPGGTGTIALAQVLSAQPDGYTLLMTNEGLVTEVPHTLKVRFDPMRDIEVIAEVGDARLALVVAATLPVKTLEEFIALAKRRADAAVAVGSYGTGGLGHLATLQLAKDCGIPLSFVPYRGTLLALQDVIGGHLPAAFVGELGLAEYVAAGKIKVLALTGSGRSPALPSVPAFGECGLPALDHLVVRVDLWAKPGTSTEVRARLRSAVAAALQERSTLDRLAAAGLSPVPQRSQAQIEAHLRTTHASVGATLRSIDIEPK